MRSVIQTVVVVTVAAYAIGCTDQAPDSADMSDPETNVLLAEWTGPYGGVPPFDAMDIATLKPALEVGMAKQLEEIDRIASNPEPPTFANTMCSSCPPLITSARCSTTKVCRV